MLELEERGWAVLRGVISRERAEELAREVDRIFPESSAPAGRVHELAAPSQRSALIAAQVLATRVELGWPVSQLLQDTLLVKPARSPARVEWHQDFTYTGYFDLPAQVSVRLALTPCTVESGCLRVLDGSHLWGPLGSLRAFRADAVGDDSTLLPEGWREREVLLELEPGDASIHHCLTFHSSDENRTPHARKTLITRLIDARCTLVPSKLPPGLQAWFPTDSTGHLTGPSFPLL